MDTLLCSKDDAFKIRNLLYHAFKEGSEGQVKDLSFLHNSDWKYTIGLVIEDFEKNLNDVNKVICSRYLDAFTAGLEESGENLS
jgi:hypothetical protein